MHAREQFRRALDEDGFVAGVLDRRPEAIAHERGIVGDDDNFYRDRSTGHVKCYRRLLIPAFARKLQACAGAAIIRTLIAIACRAGFWHVFFQLPKPTDTRPRPGGSIMATCPECDAEIEVDEFDVDKGDQLSCPECGSNLEVVGLSPIELDLSTDDDEDDDEDDLDDEAEVESDDVEDAEDEETDEEDEPWDE